MTPTPLRRRTLASLLALSIAPIAFTACQAPSSPTVAASAQPTATSPVPTPAPTVSASKQATTPAATSAPATSASRETGATAAVPTAPTPAATAPASEVDPLAYLGQGGLGKAFYFSSPSGNLLCAIDTNAAGSDPFLGRGAGCQANVVVAGGDCGPDPASRATLVMLGPDGRAGQTCTSQGVYVGELPVKVLPYGSSISVWRYRCTSETSGMTCTDLGTGASFTLSQQRAVASGTQAAVGADSQATAVVTNATDTRRSR